MCIRTCVCARVCAHMCVCVCACVRTCAYVCASEIRGIKLPFQDNTISLKHLYLVFVLNLVIFCHVGVCFCFKMRT